MSVRTRWFFPDAGDGLRRRWLAWLAVVPAVAVLALVGSLLLFPPRAWYFLTPEQLLVEAREGLLTLRRSFLRNEVVESRILEVGQGIRSSGTVAPGYCRGWFRYPELGKVWQVTDCGRSLVYLRFHSGDRVLLAPADPERFLQALTLGDVGEFPLRRNPAATTRVTWVSALAGATLAALLAMLLVTFLGPKRLAYAFEPGVLLVRTFARVKRFPILGASAQVWEPGRLVRIAGTAMPGYYTGFFWLQGKGVWVYASRTDRGVLVEGGKRVFVTPADEAAFLEAFRQMGGSVEEPPQRVR